MTHRILVVDDESRYRALYVQILRGAGFETSEAGSAEEAVTRIAAQPPSMIVSDVRMPGESGLDLLRRTRAAHPDLPFLLVTAYADVRGAVDALKLGAVDYLAKPVDLDELLAAVRDTLGVRATDTEIPAEALAGIVAESPAMRAVLRDAYRVAASDATVLLTGESGSGKEVLAQFIHRHSARRDKPLVAVNCAAIAPSLLASELFGHEKGAFTGAVAKRKGHFREAHEGTLFLDEIGDMPLELQASLLRATETGRVMPVGGDKEISVDCRLIAATNRRLEDDVVSGRFRQDLYYRLNVITLDIPPLRERPEDIPLLVNHLLAKLGRKNNKPVRGVTREFLNCLARHEWRGNVRELENVLERTLILSRGDTLDERDLPDHLRDQSSLPRIAGGATGNPTDNPLEAAERQALVETLRRHDGHRERTAQALGISRRTLQYRLKKYGLTTR
jgi:DNA-binding NtrC family response regulator